MERYPTGRKHSAEETKRDKELKFIAIQNLQYFENILFF